MVLELLKKAEILTERDLAGRAVTFNNLACYYRRQGKLHSALNYLQKALRIEVEAFFLFGGRPKIISTYLKFSDFCPLQARLEHVDNPADTHLNMCAVLSQLGRHAGALEHAQSALILLQVWITLVTCAGCCGGAVLTN